MISLRIICQVVIVNGGWGGLGLVRRVKVGIMVRFRRKGVLAMRSWRWSIRVVLFISFVVSVGILDIVYGILSTINGQP